MATSTINTLSHIVLTRNGLRSVPLLLIALCILSSRTIAGQPSGIPNCTLESGLLTSRTQDFIVIAGSGYTFAGPVAGTTLNGNIASFPTASPLNSNPMVTHNGFEDLNATFTNLLAQDVKLMYNNAVAKQGRVPISGDIGALTFTPGVYFSASTIGVTGNLTLDAQGDSNAVFLFISGSATFTLGGSQIVLVNGAQPCRVYWAVGSSATLGANSIFVGTMTAYASIAVAQGVTVTGRLFASQAVTMDNNTITTPSCPSPVALEACFQPVSSDIDQTDLDTAGSSLSVAFAHVIVAAMIWHELS